MRASGLIGYLMALCACGRIGFAPDIDSGDGSGDGVIPACAGHDEDGDGVGDACDRCPTVPDPMQEDRGEIDVGGVADGVGDACDPRPKFDGDRIALFESYAQGPQVTFTNMLGMVMWDGDDALLIGSLTAAGQAYFTSVVQFTRAELGYRLRAVAPSRLVYSGLWTHITNDDLTNAVFPQVHDMTGNAQGADMIIKEATGTGGTADVYSPFKLLARELAAGDVFRTLHDTELVTGSAQHYLVHSRSTSEVLETDLVVTRPFTGEYAIEAVGVEMELQYLVLYDVP